MGILTDFFVARADEVATMDLVDLGERPCLLAKGIDPDAVAQLDFIVTGESDRELSPLREEDSTVVFRLADELVVAPAELDDERRGEVADEWEIGDVDETSELLDELRSLARRARVEGSGLFLRVCV